MPAPENGFKTALKRGERQIGCWMSLADPYAAELMASTGFDWLVIDGEHAPNDLRSTLAQLQALRGTGVHPVVRLTAGEPWMIKMALDVGAQTLLIPMVETAEQARALVAASRYPPEGIRGVGYAVARAAGFAAIPDYGETADAQICLLVQVETRKGLENLDAILAVEGVDGVFIGPADLAASLGHLAQGDHPEVTAAIDEAITRIVAAGKAAGILVFDLDRAAHFLQLGASFVAVGADMALLANAARSLSAKAKALP
ncbi:4-hydroxy-2-oxo-heptane-1,7-dioate aldolase [Pseudoruegeria aquimaris]|uniref:Hydroxypyruvate/pyruvate aldolase n=1 Tax=Pseudoruegeria aquimaris TaxID=393663 RepID=A0A1Y5RWU5_9RHOB|nr:HpcH/HpaI aldolase/citrate lyase family protein [Pseudoruegeria aquimaris]SLN26324.1 4-hydroxy-2-oxo-heptane-1,7-dioate aldolase [Pseudoruegeria aquimaris]